MKNITIIAILTLLAAQSVAQPVYLKELQERYQIINGFKTIVNVQIDVPGIMIKPKTIEIYDENGKQPKIKGEGLVLLPKKGFVNQFSDLLTIPVHWIFLDSSGDFESYKLVSLDPKTDWVTADIKIRISDPQIEEMNLTSRETGEIFIKHIYKTGNYPFRSEISFVSERINIPLKFMGKSDFSAVKDSTGKVRGKIILEFKEFEVF